MTPIKAGGRLYLIRHAKAQARERWSGPDQSRPLTPKGRRQSEAIARDLARGRARPRATISSPATRCIETISPLAGQLGIGIEEAAWLEEGSDACFALKMLSERVAGGASLAACTHGDIIWAVLDELSKAGVDLGPRPDAPKGGVWRLDYGHGALIAGDGLSAGGALSGAEGAEGVEGAESAEGASVASASEVRSPAGLARVLRAKLLLPGGSELQGGGDD